MNKWFRFYSEALNDHKVQSLSPELFKTWINLLCIASSNRGKLHDVDRLSFELRVSKHEMQCRLDDLILAGLIDIMPDKTLEPHNWGNRQYQSDSSTDRVKKYRSKNKGNSGNDDCNVSCNVSVTPPDHSDHSDHTDNSDNKPKVLSSFKTAAREEKEPKGFIGDLNKTKTNELYVRRAEGLGLDVEDIARLTRKYGKQKPSAYFTKVCIDRLQATIPTLEEGVIRDALWGKDGESYKRVLAVLMVAA